MSLREELAAPNISRGAFEAAFFLLPRAVLLPPPQPSLLRQASLYICPVCLLPRRYRPKHHSRTLGQHRDRRHVRHPALRDLRSAEAGDHLAERSHDSYPSHVGQLTDGDPRLKPRGWLRAPVGVSRRDVAAYMKVIPADPFVFLEPGERVLASGSVQLPRFTLLESGSLLISPSHISDAGTYTCMASNSRGIDEASADLVVWGAQMHAGKLN